MCYPLLILWLMKVCVPPVDFVTGEGLCFYREQEDYVSLSFDTISSVGSNGAIIHYR